MHNTQLARRRYVTAAGAVQNVTGIGTCTDAALYVIHVGGQLIPLPADVEAPDNYCGAQTAR
jgi:hypothetical protein